MPATTTEPWDLLDELIAAGRAGRHRAFDGVCLNGHRLVEVYRLQGQLIVRYRPGASLATSMANHPAVRRYEGTILHHRGKQHRVDSLPLLIQEGRWLNPWCRCPGDVTVDLREVLRCVESGTRRAVLQLFAYE